MSSRLLHTALFNRPSARKRAGVKSPSSGDLVAYTNVKRALTCEEGFRGQSSDDLVVYKNVKSAPTCAEGFSDNSLGGFVVNMDSGHNPARANDLHAQTGSRAPRVRAGFTLVEMLCAVLVLLLVSALMAVGVQLATKAYSREVTHSEAQVLLTTLRTAVSDELRYAGTTEVNGSSVTFFSQTYGAGSEFSVDENGQITVKSGTSDQKVSKLLSKNAYPHGITANVEIKSYNENTRIFTVNITVKDSDGSELGSSNFQVKRLNKSNT